MHPHAMNVKASNPRALLAALGHESRYRIALCLLEGERCVGELATAIGLSQSCTTRHVQALERAGFVRARRDGKRVLVTIEHAAEGVAGLIRWLVPGAAPGPAREARRGAGTTARKAGASRRARRPGARGARPGEARGGGAAAQAEAPREAGPPTAEEAPHAEPLPSGKHPTPVEAPPSRPPRPFDTIEDFLL